MYLHDQFLKRIHCLCLMFPHQGCNKKLKKRHQAGNIMSTRQPWFELWLLNPQRSTVKPTEKHLGKSHAHVGISKINARSIGLSGQCQTWRFYRPRKVIFELLNFKISTNNILNFLISYISEGLSVYSMQLFELALIMQHSSASP